MKKGLPIALLSALILGTNLFSAHAVVLDWGPTNSWASGTLTHSYNVDGVPGNDITVTISSGELVSGYPKLDTDITGGKTPVEDALRLQVDLSNKTNSLTVTITFANPAGVLNPTFSIYDIDVGSPTTSGGVTTYSYQDQIRNIQATFGAATITPTITSVGSAASITAPGTVTGIANAANDSSAGNATISFTGPVNQITFTYGSGNSITGANPAPEGIAISDISFNNISAIPEINAVWVAIGALLLAGMIHTLRQNQATRLLTSASVE